VAHHEDGDRFFVQRTGDDGSYHLVLPGGRFRLRAEAGGFAARWYPGVERAEGARLVAVGAPGPRGIDFRLPRLGAGAPATAVTEPPAAGSATSRGGR
jgi:hypothetical protein